MSVNKKSKINTNIILQHSIRSSPSSKNEIFDTGATKQFVVPNTSLIKKKKTFLPFCVQLTNGTIIKSTHEGNLQLSVLPKGSTKAHVFIHIISSAWILLAQLCDHGCISTFTSKKFTIYNKQMEPQTIVTQYA